MYIWAIAEQVILSWCVPDWASKKRNLSRPVANTPTVIFPNWGDKCVHVWYAKWAIKCLDGWLPKPLGSGCSG